MTGSPEPAELSGDELTYRLHQQERLAQFGVLALETPDFTLLLQEATRLCAEGLHTRYCKAMEYLPDEDQFIVRAGVGWKPRVIGSRTGGDLQSPTGYAYKKGEPVISSHLDGETCFRTPQALVEHGIRRAINVPIATRSRRYGVLEADSPIESRFTEADIAFMQGFANLLGVAFERGQGEQALRDTEERYRLAAKATNDAIWDWDLAADRILWNEALTTFFGYPQGETNGSWWKEHIHPDDRERVVQAIHAVIDGGPEHWSMEYRFLRADGSDAYVFDRGYVIRDERGCAVRMIGAMIDLTERRQSEAALQESEEFTRRILESSTDCIKVLDADARLRFMSPGGLHVMEVDVFGSIEGCDWRDFWTGPDHEKAQQAVRTALAGGNARFQGHTPTMKGKPRWWDVAVSPIPNPDGSVDKLLSVSRDITETKQMEEHQRLLINELNHRVKNTLATVQSIASQTLRNAATLEKALAAFEARLLALSRAHNVLTRENWDGAHLREIVAEAVAPYSNRREDRLHLSGPDVRLPPRMALALAMALQELATNAVKYGALSNAVGEIRIQWTLDRTQEPPRLHLTWEESGGPSVQVPTRRGFGTRLIERSLALDLEGDVRIAFAPGGVTCTVDAPLLPDGSPPPA
ncbi:HWE histidine kinase domain-containing protein [Microvirga sp. BSC39]|uniref:HWE histidine kinase domain-containing protein n=1 Tax=Microvirga sp. BSC39 TaxID=1549810 RepID=UPI00068C8676|nr:HWE histidine kinase domain-containing protein [Microvirga sp. BSC39]